MIKIRGLKIVKIDAKNDPLKLIKKWVKIDLPWGGRKSSKIDFFGSGGPGPQIYKFFEILHFFAKTLHF
jgi:hypothetical protein